MKEIFMYFKFKLTQTKDELHTYIV